MLRLCVPFLSFQIISRIMRCFQFILKLETTSLTNNNDDIVRIISVCGYIFRKLIVHAAKFTDSEDCHSHEGYRSRDRCEAMHRVTDGPAAYFDISSSNVCCFKRALFTVVKYFIASRNLKWTFCISCPTERAVDFIHVRGLFFTNQIN